jgi:hypothetical protein
MCSILILPEYILYTIHTYKTFHVKSGFDSHWGHGCFSLVGVVCCQVRGLCDGLIARLEESYRLWCVVGCELETS